MLFDFNTGEKILIITGLITLGISVVGWGKQWFKELRNLQRITIRLVAENDPGKCLHELSYKPKRGQITRAEVQGLLGAFSTGKDYNIKFLKSPHFFERVDRVVSGDADFLDIPVSATEIIPFHPPS